MCRSLWHRNVRGTRERWPSASTALTALAPIATLMSLVSLVAAGCSGEHALSPRDASALAGSGGKAGAGSAGNAGTGGDAGTGGAGDSGGAAGGGAGAGGTGGMRPVGTGTDGSSCSSGGDCLSSWCVDTVCCATECLGACMTCKGGTPGVCLPANDGSNPRNACAMMSPGSCGTTGVCNGAGACRYHAAGQACDSTPGCDATASSLVTARTCNGMGDCVASTSQSCNGYRCASATCGTTCSADTDCAASHFCSASVCYAKGTVNLAGNGDLETGTTSGWGPANFSGTIALSSVAASGVSYSGGYSVVGTNRTFAYQGPAYTLPSGPGKYIISAWGLQRDMAMISGALQVRLTCQTSTSYPDVAYGVNMPQNIWTSFSGTVDTASGLDCLPTGAAPGLVRSASVYLNHPETVPAPFPNLYLDDLVVRVTDGHNLVGNPNFEAGLADGWSLSAGSSTVAIDTTAAHGGTKSLHQSGRSIPAAGPRYVLPTGTARYAFSFWVRHAPPPSNAADTQTYDLMLQPTYNCISPPGQVVPPPIAVETAVPKNTWVELKGTATLPPADAPTGCKLSLASVYVRHEGTACSGPCPELFVDDVSITLAP
jgi:hypothetical protein